MYDPDARLVVRTGFGSTWRDWVLTVATAAIWGWQISMVLRIAMPGYGIGGPPELGGVPLTAALPWTLLWLVALAIPSPRLATLAGAVGAVALMVVEGAGSRALLAGPAAALILIGVRQVLAGMVPAGGERTRVRLLIVILLLSLMSLAFLQWLFLLGWSWR